MSESEFVCAVCNQPIEGELSERTIFVDKELDFALGDKQTGYSCQNCSASICYPPKKHFGMSMIKFGLFKGWKNVVCPVCGEKFFPGKIIIKRAGKYFDPATKKRIGRAYVYLRDENLMRDSTKRQILLSTLREFPAEIFDGLITRIEKNPSYDVRMQISNILALGRLIGLVDPGLDVPDIDIYDLVKVEQCLMSLTTDKNYKVRKGAWRLLVRLSAKTGSRDLAPLFIDRMLDTEEVDHIRAEIAGELGLIKDDERVVDGLIKALKYRRERAPEEAAAGLSDLFRSLPSIAEMAAKSLRQIGDEKGLQVLNELKRKGIKFK